ncbi:MAG: hypothetical protein ACK5QC_07655 [Bacteroidota bacterium]
MVNQKHNYLSYVWRKNNNGKSKILFIAFICFFNFVFGNGEFVGGSGLQNRREQLRNGGHESLAKIVRNRNSAKAKAIIDARDRIVKLFNITEQEVNAMKAGTYVSGIGNFGKYSTKLDDAVTVLQKESLFGNTASTFLDAEYRTVQSTKQVSVYRAFGGNAKLGGTFVTTTKDATRTELALLDEWNNSMRFEATINVPSGIKMNIGKVGPQTSTNGLQTLEGGGDQVVLPFQWNNQWVTKIVDKTSGKVYNSVSEFAVDFPNLVN